MLQLVTVSDSRYVVDVERKLFGLLPDDYMPIEMANGLVDVVDMNTGKPIEMRPYGDSFVTVETFPTHPILKP